MFLYHAFVILFSPVVTSSSAIAESFQCVLRFVLVFDLFFMFFLCLAVEDSTSREVAVRRLERFTSEPLIVVPFFTDHETRRIL